MGFYKISVKVSRGLAEREVNIFQIASSKEQALNIVKKIQVWKGPTAEHKVLNIEEISEHDYIIGLIQNPLYWEGEIGVSKAHPLNWVEKKVYYGKGAFKTEDGRQLVSFCTNYKMIEECFEENIETLKNNQKILEAEYTTWAERLINKNFIKNPQLGI